MTVYKILWLWLPIAVLIAQIVLEFSVPGDVLSVLHSENGPHELAQFVIISCAFVVAVLTLARAYQYNFYVGIWMSVAALCCFYVSAEEVSWGQHFFNWSTPEYWENINDQAETNLHNTSSWLDQKPRIALELGVVIGGLVIPMLMQFRPGVLPVRFAMIYPPPALMVTAGVFVFLKIIDKADVFGVNIFKRVSEVQELYLFYFVLLYLWMLRGKLVKE